MNELVSVIIPTYKRPTTLKRAIDSVLNQTYKNVEVVVADDNGIGTEGGLDTEAVMQEYKNDSRVKYVQHEVNINGSAARNSGFRKSEGEFIMFLDDDDEFLPDKVSSQIEKLRSLDASWGACYSKYIRVAQDGKKIVSKSGEKREGDLLVEELKRNLFVGAGSNLMVRRSIVEEVGGFNENFLRNQDMEFLVKILKKYKLAYVDTLGLKIYVHPRVKRKETWDQITQKFLDSFNEEIEALGERKNEVYSMIELQRFRSYLRGRKFKKAFSLIKHKKVSLFNSIRYMLHLSYRHIFKISCGF